MSVMLETSLGNLVIDLHYDKVPQLCLNFIKLCKVKYYSFCSFHNIQSDFMAQTGDPSSTGQGGESIFGLIKGEKDRYFPAEFHPKLKHKRKGTVSMAVIPDPNNGESGYCGSQFFITCGDKLSYLDGKHAVFGKVVEGFDVLEAINGAIVDETGRPFKDIRIRHAFILYDPFEDPEGLVIPDKSPVPSKEMLETIRIAEDEEIEPDLPPEEVEEIQRKKEAKAKALTLEMVGDLPFADIKPPENVLFVCKLNPVTTDADLELIFSRFGKINSCEIIRDKKTGDSLSYAFIEFDEQKSCEEAYFKMDNVLIDDRRIHVDFSQSVSHLHKGWLNSRFESLNAANQLVQRKRYRDEPSGQEDEKYDMVFDHGEDLQPDGHYETARRLSKENVKKEDSRKSRRARSRSPSREKYRERKHRYQESSSSSRYSDRKRSRSRSRDRRKRH